VVSRALVASIAGTVVSAPFILPVILWLPHAYRAAGVAAVDLQRWNFHPVRLVEFLVPNLFRWDVSDPVSPVFQSFCGNDVTPLPWFLSVYVGASVLALSTLGAVADRRMRWLVAGGGLLCWAALGPHGGFGQIAARVPVLGAFRFWEKLLVWVALALALAAGAGAMAVLERRAVGRVQVVAVAAGLLLLLGLVALTQPEAIPGTAGPAVRAVLTANVGRGAFHAGVVLAVLATLIAVVVRPAFRRLAPSALVTLVAADLFGGNAGAYVLGREDPPSRPPLARSLEAGGRVLTPFTLREDRWPGLGRLESTWEWARRTLAPAWNVEARLNSPHDYVGLREARWSTLRAAQKDDPEAARLGLFGFAHLVVPGDVRLGERAGAPAGAAVEAVDQELPAWLVAVPHRPRAYLAERARQVTAQEAFRFAVQGGVAGEVVVEAPVPSGGGPGRGEARIEADTPGETLVRTDASATALLVLNDAWTPGWSATVDGTPAEILRANWAARAVQVPAGAHRVLFRYRTPGLRPGWVIALAGAAALGTWAVAGRRRRADR
jgi:hypothetical protein